MRGLSEVSEVSKLSKLSKVGVVGFGLGQVRDVMPSQAHRPESPR